MVSYAACNKTYTTNQYSGMSPARIVLAMFDGALRSMERAEIALMENDVKTRGESVSKAIAIVSELQNSLNMKDGREIAENLHALYDYINRELIRFNISKDRKALDSCRDVVQKLRDGWNQMLNQQAETISSAKISSGGYL